MPTMNLKNKFNQLGDQELKKLCSLWVSSVLKNIIIELTIKTEKQR